MVNGPLPRAWSPLTWPASWLYGAAVRLRNAGLDRRPGWRAPRPVISVGNLTAGGTGKSPMVRWICRELRAEGLRPAVAMRGYAGGSDADEAVEHRESMPGVHVWVGADRRARIEEGLRSDPAVQVIVLDDGFQHRAVRRDFDLVLVDASRPALRGALLPHGWLREPAGGLRRASAVVLTRAEAVDATLEATVSRLHGRPPLARCAHAWTGLVRFEPTGAAESVVEALRGLPVAIWAGVGNPDAVVAEATRLGAEVRDVPRIVDHASFDAAVVARLERRAASAGAKAVLCTAKDWVKLRTSPPSLPVLVPRLGLRFGSGEAALRASIMSAIRAWNPA